MNQLVITVAHDREIGQVTTGVNVLGKGDMNIKDIMATLHTALLRHMNQTSLPSSI